MRFPKISFWFVFFLVLLGSCKDKKQKTITSESVKEKQISPSNKSSFQFNEENAYQHIQKQVDFGPRIPGTTAHKECADFSGNYVYVESARMTAQVEIKQNKAGGCGGDIEMRKLI